MRNWNPFRFCLLSYCSQENKTVQHHSISTSMASNCIIFMVLRCFEVTRWFTLNDPANSACFWHESSFFNAYIYPYLTTVEKRMFFHAIVVFSIKLNVLGALEPFIAHSLRIVAVRILWDYKYTELLVNCTKINIINHKFESLPWKIETNVCIHKSQPH